MYCVLWHVYHFTARNFGDAQSFILGQLVYSSTSPVCPNLFSTHFYRQDILNSILNIKHAISCLHDKPRIATYKVCFLA